MTTPTLPDRARRRAHRLAGRALRDGTARWERELQVLLKLPYNRADTGQTRRTVTALTTR